MVDVAKSHGINFLPLYSPCKKYSTNRTIDQQVEFTDEEMKHFKRRFEEGYDVPGDTHCIIQWYDTYVSSIYKISGVIVHVCIPQEKHHCMSMILKS